MHAVFQKYTFLVFVCVRSEPIVFGGNVASEIYLFTYLLV